MKFSNKKVSLLRFALWILVAESALAIRLPERVSESIVNEANLPLKTAVFALGSFWRSEAFFGCVPGVVRTSVGYAGGTKVNPEFRNLGDHAEAVQVEYDPRMIQFRKLLDVFWSSHDSRQIFGQGPDVGNQYRSIIFVNGTEETRLAAVGKEKEQTRDRSTLVTTEIQQLGTFYLAESEHQKFELKRNPNLLQLLGNMRDEELTRSSVATKLNSYTAELCPSKIQKDIEGKISEIFRKGWPVLRDI
ncbi:peptide methionine sulfoxide reductase A5 [Aristolochia californica]|uniref:peptide methionine sulfoxide reductase A5 n=1 Tax=Aristolochia californica TaxID=171875 RepID=UPI0035E1FE11